MFTRFQPEPSHRPLILVGMFGVAAATTIGWMLEKAWRPSQNKKLRAAEALGAGAAVLCLSVALDSGIEHYRGQFKDRAMFIGPTMALIGFAAATYVAFRPEQANAKLPKIIFATVGLSGLAGLGFHTYNILKRPGELDALNLFYGAPMGAQAALSLVGLYGAIAGEMQGNRAYVKTRLPRHTAGLIAFSLAGAIAEAGLLHFRGAFQDPVMYAPVTIPPLAAIAIGAAAFSPRATGVAEPLLKATAILGIAGPMFHAYGIHRNMGGWRNWSQMILQGPPLPAPPAFLGIAIAGLGLIPTLAEKKS